jgi:formylglycine-generating enzyme required for sulfatase activity
MGDLVGYGDSSSKPAHTVSINAFWISRYEVTFDQYDAYARAVGKPLPPDEGWGRGTRPVVNVSWEDAKAFAAWVSQISGLVYRLPSEAEWEYAARAGTRTDYYWGERYGEDGTHTEPPLMNDWVWDGGTVPVGSFPANGWGLHDMLGNASEWTEDCWSENYDGAPTDGSAWTVGDCKIRALRGGSWCDAPGCQKVWIRAWEKLSGRSSGNGFRLARSR